MNILSLISLTLVQLIILQEPTKTEAFCSSLLHLYFSCNNLPVKQYNDTENNRLVWYFDLDHDLSDKWFSDRLKSITNLNQAMSLFKDIHNDLLAKPNFNRTQCVTDHYYFHTDYGYFFNHSRFYPEMVNILKTVRDKYTQIDYDMSLMYGLHQEIGFPSLDDFCFQYDFTLDFTFTILEAHYCYMQLEDYAMYTCRTYLDPTNIFASNLTNYANSSKELYLACIVSYMDNRTTCPLDVERAIAFSFMVPINHIVRTRTNMTAYLDGLITMSKAMVVPYKTTHASYMEVTPYAGTSTKCDFSKMPVLFDTNVLKINCSGSPMASTSNITSLNMLFILDLKTSFNFVLSSKNSLPANFGAASSNKSEVKNPNGKNWLQMKMVSATSILITDFSTNATIIVNQREKIDFQIILVAPNSLYTNSNAKGLLVTGCGAPVATKRPTTTTRNGRG